MKWFVTILSIALTAPLVIGDTPTGEDSAKKPATPNKAVEILKKTDVAAKAVSRVQYTASFSAGQTISGKAAFAGPFSNGYQKFRFDVEVRSGEPEVTRRLSVGGDGENFFLIDWENKIAYEDIDPGVMGTDGRIAQAIAMAEFVHPTPFSDEINAKSVELKGEGTVGGEACHVILVDYGRGGGQKATWFVSKKDFLPRRVDRESMGRTGQTATTSQVITELVVDPTFDESIFKLTLPDGFTKSDDFAPTRTPPR